MARPLRIEFAGALYHVTSRGDRRENIFESNDDRQSFLSVLGEVCTQYNWVCHAYCLMDNHYHLLIETPEANLSKGMRQLNGVYTQTFNRHYRRVGHVFQGRYKAIFVEKESYLLELARYIVLNPVRAQMVRTAKDWPWSSYRATAGMVTPQSYLQVDWLLATFGRRKSLAMEGYKQFIKEGKNQPSPWQSLRNQVFLGDETFVQEVQLRHEGSRDDNKVLSEIPASQRRAKALSLREYERLYPDRNLAIVNAYKSGAYTLREVGEHFDLHYSTVSGIVSHHKSKT
jgi:REP element-mobilizing transposase RayT